MESNQYVIANRRGNGTIRRGDRLGRLGQHWYQSDMMFRNRDQRNLRHRSWAVNKDNTDAFSETWEEFEGTEKPKTQHKTDRRKKKQGRSSGALWYQRRNDVLKKMKHLNLQSTDYPVSKTRSYFSLDRKLRKARCYICFKRGHIYMDCPNKNRWNSFKRMNRLKGKMFEKSDAKEKNVLFCETKIVPVPNWLVLGSDERGWDEFWYVSNQYPRHMTPNIDQFQHFKAGTIGTSKTGEQGLEVKGFGEVHVSTEEKVYVIPGVYFVPNVGFNTLSLSQLVVQGFKVIIKGTTCILRRQFEEDMSEYDSGDSSMETEEEISGKELEGNTKTMEDEYDRNISVNDSKESSDDDQNLNATDEENRLQQEKERVAIALEEYFNSLYHKGLTIDEGLNKTEQPRIPSKNELDSFIGFLKMVNEEEIADGCKELVKRHFQKLVTWFYEVILQCTERPMPVIINNSEVCLLDLYLTVRGLGGHTYVSLRNKWVQVARAMGFPKEYAEELREVYATYLSLLGTYFEMATNYSRNDVEPEISGCRGVTGVGRKDLPAEEDVIGCCSKEGGMMMDNELGKQVTGRVEFDDDNMLIITFEEDESKNDGDAEDMCSSSEQEEMKAN